MHCKVTLAPHMEEGPAKATADLDHRGRVFQDIRTGTTGREDILGGAHPGYRIRFKDSKFIKPRDGLGGRLT